MKPVNALNIRHARIRRHLTRPALLIALLGFGPAPWAGNAAAPVDAPTVPASEPAAKPLDWTGPYAGLTAGIIVNDTNLQTHHFALVEDPCQRDNRATSFLPGALAGYLRQLDNSLVLGAEADFTYPDSTVHSNCDCPAGAFDKFTVKNRIQGSLRLRLGYAAPHRLLPYLTTGISFADQGLQYTNEYGDRITRNTAQVGWVIGGGLEYGFLNGLSMRAEYLYTDYGRDLNLPFDTVYGVSDPNGRASAALNSNQVRAAINYRF